MRSLTGYRGTAYEKIRELQRENRSLRGRAQWLEQSRDRWRQEARAWRWAARQKHGTAA